MTITTNPARNEYTATAGQTVFNYTFKIFDNTDLNVYITPAGQEANDSIDLTTAYSVDTATIGDEDGGFITLDTGTSDGDYVTIVSNVPESRTTDYQNNGDFRPDTVNNDFDRVVQLVKQVDSKADRTIGFQESLQNPTSLKVDSPVPNAVLGVNPDASGLYWRQITETALETASAVLVDRYADGDGDVAVGASDTVITLRRGNQPGTNFISVYVNGVRQIVGIDYTETSTTLTLTFAVLPADKIDVYTGILTPSGVITDSSFK
jgi:hypothetical protein